MPTLHNGWAGAGTAVFALLSLVLSITWADPDLWGHVKFGGDIASSELHARADYSCGSDRPWVNHAWAPLPLMGSPEHRERYLRPTRTMRCWICLDIR